MPTEKFDLKYDYEFDVEADNNTAAAIYRSVKESGPRILDLGSGPAVVSSRFASQTGHRIVCADMDEGALSAASEKGVHETHVVNLDSPDWHYALAREEFDCVILADVLEHLRQPERLLRELVNEGFLAPGARLVISVPNASHESVVGSLLAGDFQYTKTGILDATHVRWFTLDSLTRMLEQEGFAVINVQRTIRSLEQTQQSPHTLTLSATARLALNEMGEDGKTLQYVVDVRQVTTPPSGITRVQIDEIRTEYDLAAKALTAALREEASQATEKSASLEKDLRDALVQSSEIANLNKTMAALRIGADARESELASLRILVEQERSAGFAEFTYLTGELEAHRRHARKLRSQVMEVTSSASWKLARVLISATHPISTYKKLLIKSGLRKVPSKK